MLSKQQQNGHLKSGLPFFLRRSFADLRSVDPVSVIPAGFVGSRRYADGSFFFPAPLHCAAKIRRPVTAYDE